MKGRGRESDVLKYVALIHNIDIEVKYIGEKINHSSSQLDIN